MICITTATRRLASAASLPVLLDAAYGAFEEILSAICGYEDSGGEFFAALAFAAATAADGRDAVAFAPSLPARLTAPGESACCCHSPADFTGLAALSATLATRLAQAAGASDNAGDRAACQDAARLARQLHVLLAGNGP